MVASACLQITPDQLDLHHVTRLTLCFMQMTHKSGDLANALFKEKVMEAKTAHLLWAADNFLG
jgi:hypothetical protein